MPWNLHHGRSHSKDRVVFIKDPSALPRGLKHPDAIDSLSKDSKLVILLSHGNKYALPPGWIMPHNVRLLEYDLDMASISKCVTTLKDLLKQHGIDVYSRHLTNTDPMPIVLAGACMTMRTGTFPRQARLFRRSCPKVPSDHLYCGTLVQQQYAIDNTIDFKILTRQRETFRRCSCSFSWMPLCSSSPCI
jgi:hypothetical protein